MQHSAIAFTFLAPLILWALARWFPTPRFGTLVRRVLAVGLLAFEVAEPAGKIVLGEATLANTLPMQLCDWVLLAVAASLWFRWQLGFELGYFWGLAGTIQALFTPAIDPAVPAWRLFIFFYFHALVVVSVLHLLIAERCRPWPQSLVRVFICSEIYAAAAIAVNALTGGNYGFLAHKPPQASMLDLFSDTHWLYILGINAMAFLFFPLLYLPWLAWDFAVKRPQPAAPIPPA